MRVNFERTQHGLPALQFEPGLQVAARAHTEDMTRGHYFAHTGPAEPDLSLRVAWWNRQLVGEAGENIWLGESNAPRYYPSGKKIVDDLMTSPGHRANILRREFTHIGVSVVMDRGNLITVRVTQDFATVVGYLAAPVPNAVTRGSRLQLDLKGAEKVDLYLPSQERIVAGPFPISEVVIPAQIPAGRYALRFYFPEGHNNFNLHYGPSLDVR